MDGLLLLAAGMESTYSECLTCGFFQGPCCNRVRLYSAKTFKYLGTLAHHKQGCNAIAWAYSANNLEVTTEDMDSFERDEMELRSRWLVSGGKDGRIAIWQLVNFLKK